MKFLCLGAVCAVSATPLMASTSLYELDLRYVVTDSEATCAPVSCEEPQEFVAGDTVDFTLRFHLDDEAEAFVPAFVGGIRFVSKSVSGEVESGVGWHTAFAFDDFSDPFLPAGTFDVLGFSEFDLRTEPSGLEVAIDSGFVVYGATDWFQSNGAPFDPVTFQDGIIDGIGDRIVQERFDGNIVYEERTFLELTSLTLAKLGVSGGGGTSAADPFLPIEGAPEDLTFAFSVPGSTISPDVPTWFDPEIAIGYDFEIFGADVTGIQLPDFATVPDSDGYLIEVAGGTYAVGVGGILDLATLGLTDITTFSILGIDRALGLDPENPLAFATGLFLSAYDPDGLVYVEQTPITAPVPVPAALPLVMTGFGALTMVVRRRKT